jgi:RecA-family ATPase
MPRRDVAAEARAIIALDRPVALGSVDALPLHKQNGTQAAPSVDDVGPRFAVRPVVVCLGDVKAERISWLAHGVLPFGKFVLFEGDPGTSKSTLLLDFAARITTGQSVLGAEPREPRNVVLVTYEDGLADTVRPRIDALGGDPNRIFVFRCIAIGDGEDEREPMFPDDVASLRAIVEEHDAALVIVDPLGAALSESTDSHKDASVRRVVSRLARLAEDTATCVAGIRHLIKGSAANALRAGGGSIAFIAAARVAMLVSEHPDDADKPQHERRRVLACVKNNLAPHLPSRVFELWQPEGHEQPRIRWLGESPLSADDLNAAHAAVAPEERDGATERGDWLREVLSSGPLDSKELFKLARAEGYQDRTLRRTAHAIGVEIRREGVGRSHRTMWSITPLRTQDPTADTPAGHENVSAVAGVGQQDVDVERSKAGHKGGFRGSPVCPEVGTAQPTRTIERDGRQVPQVLRPTQHGDRWNDLGAA